MFDITMDYYTGTFQGEPVDPAVFPDLCQRAEEIVEEMTGYCLTAIRIQEMPQDLRDRVKKAVCAQVEYLDANGGTDMDFGGTLQSAGLGKFTYTRANDATGSAGQSIYAPRALRLLYPTGLLYRGGGCL